MKNLIKIIVFFVFTSALYSQEYSGGIETATGFKISDPQPIDDRTVVADSLSLISLPNKYAGLQSYSIEDDAIFVFDGTVWKKIKADTSTQLELGETSTTAYRGDRGKIAFEHSQITTGNPHNVSLQEAANIDNTIKDKSIEMYATGSDETVMIYNSEIEVKNHTAGNEKSVKVTIGSIDYEHHTGFKTKVQAFTPSKPNSIYFQDGSGTVAFLDNVISSVENSFSAVNISSGFSLDATHKNKQILVTCNSCSVTIPNTLPNNFNVTLDFSGTGATLINNASATGDGDHTTSPYIIPQNGMIYIYKTESGTVRIKGDIL